MGSIRALATLLPPLRGQYAPPRRLCAHCVARIRPAQSGYWHKANTPLLPAPIIAPGDLDKCPTKDRILVTKNASFSYSPSH